MKLFPCRLVCMCFFFSFVVVAIYSCVYWCTLVSFHCPKKSIFASVNIKLYYCIFWLCLVATQSMCVWCFLIWKRFSITLTWLLLAFFGIQSDFPHQPPLNACLLLKFCMEFSKKNTHHKIEGKLCVSTVWNAKMIVSYAVICTK